jgi:diacylglycerol kinase (ATP)
MKKIMASNKKKIHFIINPIAGKGKAGTVVPLIEEHIDHKKYKTFYHISKKPKHAIKISEKAAESGCDIIVAIGGDGTVNEVASVAIKYNIPLGIIPIGSGNGLGNYLHIPHDVAECVKILNNYNIKPIDVGYINDFLFVNVAGVGFDAEVAKAYSKLSMRGFAGYFKSTVLHYIPYKSKKYKIRFNNQMIARKALLISFANSGQYGYNTSIAPHAKIDDGLIDMCIMNKVPAVLVPFVASQFFTKTIDHTQYHESYQITEAYIYLNKKSVIHLDGEPVKLTNKILHVRVQSKGLQVICPKDDN